jgi:hypothetical protein
MSRRAASLVLLIPTVLAACSRDTAADSLAVGAVHTLAPVVVAQPDSVAAVISREATRDGELTITEVRYAGTRSRTYIVRADGRVLHVEELAEAAGAARVWERPAFQSDGSVALVWVNPGGNACPSLYHLVTLRAGRAPAITPAFGTCIDPDTVWMEGDALRMRFSDYAPLSVQMWSDYRRDPPTTWAYRRGALREEAP